MDMDGTTAQIIVNQLEKWIAGDIWVTNQNNHVLGGSQSTHSIAANREDGRLSLHELQMTGHGFNLPLHNSHEEVGRLIIDNPAQPDQATALMAQKLAELIVHQRSVFEQMFDRQWALDKFVHGLLHGNSLDTDATVQEQALLMDIDLDLPRVAVVIDILPLQVSDSSSAPGETSTPETCRISGRTRRMDGYMRRRLIDRAQLLLPGYGHIYSFFDEHRFVILLAIHANLIEQTDGVSQRIKRAIQALIDDLGCPSNRLLSAGIGRTYPDWQALPQSYQDAVFALETGHALIGSGRVYGVSDLGMAGFVCANSSAVKSELAEHLLQPLFDKPELIETLDAFLNANLSVGAAASQLHLHRHGLTYRLARIHALTGLDPNHFQDAAQLAAALQWHRASKANPA